MSEPLRVTHAVLSLDFGGLERIVLSLAKAGLEMGQEVSVLCLERPGTLAPQVEALGVPVVCLNKPPGLAWETTEAARKALDRLRPDVLHTHQIAALLYAGKAARCQGVPVVLHTKHSNHIQHCKSRVQTVRTRLLWGYASRYADRFCCVSRDVLASAGRYRTVRSSILTYVPNGIDTAAFGAAATARAATRDALGIPADAPVVGSVSRLSEVKQQDVLVRAFAELLPAFPSARLILVGDGPTRPQLEQLVALLGLGDAVRFAGYQTNPERFLAAMDVFALPSRSEAMPLVILEAWAAGLPVVATRVGGIPWMVEDGKTGYLADPGDVAGLADRLRLLLADRARAKEMGRAGQELVGDEYDIATMAGTYERHYREILTQKKAGLLCASSR